MRKKKRKKHEKAKRSSTKNNVKFGEKTDKPPGCQTMFLFLIALVASAGEPTKCDVLKTKTAPTIAEVYDCLDSMVLTTEQIQEIIDSICTLAEGYVYLDIAKQPPQPADNPAYFHTIDVVNEFKKISTEPTPLYKLNIELQKVVHNTYDGHFAFVWSENDQAAEKLGTVFIEGLMAVLPFVPRMADDGTFSAKPNPYWEVCFGANDEKIVSHTINIFGIGESAVDDIFAGEMNAMTNPSMAPYAKECDCLLKVTAKAHTEAEAEEMLRPVMAEVQEKLGEVVYGVDVDCIEQSVLKLLREKNMTFSAAESCTGGDVAKRFTDMAGASSFFLGGVVTYTNGAKAKLLGIDRDMIEDKGAVSYEVAKEMAENVRRIIGTDIGVGVTGLAGPDGDGVHEVGTVFVSMATSEQTWVNELHLGAYRTRSFIRRMAGNHVYDMMRRYLSGLKVM